MPASSPTAKRDASLWVQHSAEGLERVGNAPAPETFHAALIDCIKAAGGSKAIAAELWPAKAATIELCGGVTKPLSPQPLRRCTNCEAYRWGAAELKPQMRQQADGTWHCPDELPMGVVER